jgi:energy-converting hydrogenase Eha subunit G
MFWDKQTYEKVPKLKGKAYSCQLLAFFQIFIEPSLWSLRNVCVDTFGIIPRVGTNPSTIGQG